MTSFSIFLLPFLSPDCLWPHESPIYLFSEVELKVYTPYLYYSLWFLTLIKTYLLYVLLAKGHTLNFQDHSWPNDNTVGANMPVVKGRDWELQGNFHR